MISNRISSWFLITIVITFFIPITLQNNEDAEQDAVFQNLRRHHIRGQTHRKRTPVCVNGKPEGDKCACEQDYVGRHCEKKKHCATFRRYRNGSCPICENGYTGEYCEVLNCVHGHLNEIATECICDNPYSGTFCADLNTSKVYGFYNRKVYWLGPLGALSLIPMCALYLGCEYMAQKRQVKRVGQMLGGQNINVKDKTLQHLLMS
ncbi:unnamed protein product [Auanema sp. JU1783]|nr:unnamed protein product [Auanema sp. JU1783]